MNKKKNSDIYDGELEVEHYHTLCVIHEDSEDNEGQFFRTRNFVMEECVVPVGRRRKVH